MTSAPESALPAAPTPWLALAVVAAGVAALFGPTILRLAAIWESDPNYSHGYLVPVFSAWMAWGVVRREGVPAAGRPGLGLVSGAFGVACHLAAIVTAWPPLDCLGLVFVLRGVLVAVGGPGWAAKFAFPLVFLFFMFPLPANWTAYLALLLQDLVSRVAEVVLGLFFVVYRQGHTLHIAGMGQGLVVAEECSGLRQIVAFVAFAALYGYWVGRSVPHRVALVLAAVPVAVVANVVRVLLMNLGAYWFGTNWLSTNLHHFPVLFTLPLGLALFLLCDRVLAGIRPDRQNENENPVPPAVGSARVGPAAGRTLVGAGVALLIAAAGGFALSHHLAAAGAASFPDLRGPLAGVPLADLPAGWRGEDRSPEYMAQLRARVTFGDDLLSRTYVSPAGAVADVYAVYSRVGEDRKHHPEICVRDVGGAPEDLGFRREIPLDAAGTRVAQRFRFQTGGGRAWVVYYWYYTVLPHPDESRTPLQAFHQRVGVDAPGVTVQVSTGEESADALAAIERTFLPALDAAMQAGVLPPAAVGHTRLPIGLERK